jgi:hypothetical protein
MIMSSFVVSLVAQPTSTIGYQVVTGSASVPYAGVINVLILDTVSVVVYNGSLQNYSTTILLSRFPVSIAVTPLIYYQNLTTSNIAAASNVTLTLLPIMTTVGFTVLGGGVAYTGSLSVQVLDVNSNSIYSGTAASWSSSIPLMTLPLSITVTPNATY